MNFKFQKDLRLKLFGWFSAFLLLPFFVQAAPQKVEWYPFNHETMTAAGYVVIDRVSGETLLAKNADLVWQPASLTKLVTAMVVLDSKPNLNRSIAMKKSDEVGGARIFTKAGVKYKAKDLLYASLIASANNATNALTRVTGLTREQFVAKMNDKAKALGASNTVFVEPTGISQNNLTTPSDFAKIAKAAFSDERIQKITQLPSYAFTSTNNRRYRHLIKTTDRLLGEGSWIVLGGKTGYLDESQYNFAGGFKDVDGKDIIVVLFGSQSRHSQFFETKQLALWTWLNYKWENTPGQVAGVSIMGSAKNN